MGTQPPPPKKGAHSSPPPLPILAHVCSGQTAGWIRIPRGTEVRLRRPGDVSWGPSSRHGKGHSSPLTFWPPLLWHGRPTQLLLSTYLFIPLFGNSPTGPTLDGFLPAYSSSPNFSHPSVHFVGEFASIRNKPTTVAVCNLINMFQVHKFQPGIAYQTLQ